MAALVFPDTTVLCNFAVVRQMGLLEGWLRGRGRWTSAVRFEVGRSRAYHPALGDAVDGRWLGEVIELEGHEEAVERMRLGVFGGMPEEPLKHLGEAQTCYLIRHLSEFEDSWWVTEDGDAYDFGVRSGMQTLRTFEVMQHMVADGDLTAEAALALMRAMEEAGRALLHVPQRPSSFC